MDNFQNGNCDWQLNNEDCGEMTMKMINIAELVVEAHFVLSVPMYSYGAERKTPIHCCVDMARAQCLHAGSQHVTDLAYSSYRL